MDLWIDDVKTPIGVVTLVVEPDSGALCGLEFESGAKLLRERLEARYGSVSFVRRPDPHGLSARVRGYFDGEVTALDAVAVSTGGTAFQERVWAALRAVSAGSTATYGEIAAALGRPGAARAVGLANALNPVALVVPCHRIIGADGTLTGYAGGLDRKRWLLAHEARHAPQRRVPPSAMPELPFA